MPRLFIISACYGLDGCFHVSSKYNFFSLNFYFLLYQPVFLFVCAFCNQVIVDLVCFLAIHNIVSLLKLVMISHSHLSPVRYYHRNLKPINKSENPVLEAPQP
jgi:hypothetical protein